LAAEEGVDADLVHAIISLESRYDPLALSRRGAKGLMQLTAPTASRYAVHDPFDPAANLRGGIRHLRFLQELFPGRLSWALAAYNAGEHAVLRYQGIPPFRETQAYVTRILAHYAERTVETGRAILPFGRAAEAAAP
jgi:soluble lytic murein transglycosylase-like protein